MCASRRRDCCVPSSSLTMQPIDRSACPSNAARTLGTHAWACSCFSLTPSLPSLAAGSSAVRVPQTPAGGKGAVYWSAAPSGDDASSAAQYIEATKSLSRYSEGQPPSKARARQRAKPEATSAFLQVGVYFKSGSAEVKPAGMQDRCMVRAASAALRNREHHSRCRRGSRCGQPLMAATASSLQAVHVQCSCFARDRTS